MSAFKRVRALKIAIAVTVALLQHCEKKNTSGFFVSFSKVPIRRSYLNFNRLRQDLRKDVSPRRNVHMIKTRADVSLLEYCKEMRSVCVYKMPADVKPQWTTLGGDFGA